MSEARDAGTAKLYVEKFPNWLRVEMKVLAARRHITLQQAIIEASERMVAESKEVKAG